MNRINAALRKLLIASSFTRRHHKSIVSSFLRRSPVLLVTFELQSLVHARRWM